MIELFYWLFFGWLAYTVNVFLDIFISLDYINNYLFVFENENLKMLLKYSIKIGGLIVLYFGYTAIIRWIFPDIYFSIFKED